MYAASPLALDISILTLGSLTSNCLPSSKGLTVGPWDWMTIRYSFPSPPT